jgi:hypothetical protein
MRYPLSQCQRLTSECKTLVGISEHPIGLRTKVASTHARIVPAIQLVVKPMALGIIEETPGFAVRARHRRLARK